MLTKRRPKHLRSRALSYGIIGAIIGAVVFRVLSIGLSAYLLKYTFVKFIGGAYLVFIAVKHLLLEHSDGSDEKIVLDDAGNPKIVDAETGESLNIARENIEIESIEKMRLGFVEGYESWLVTKWPYGMSAHETHAGFLSDIRICWTFMTSGAPNVRASGSS